MQVREERPSDHTSIDRLIAEAFKTVPHSSGAEAGMVTALRADNALWLSLVGLEEGEIVGHAALSEVSIAETGGTWVGLGPVAVRPDLQRRGLGRALIVRALEMARARGASGCVVLGDPQYYGQFGFKHDPKLIFSDLPPPLFQVLAFNGSNPQGTVTYHPAFG